MKRCPTCQSTYAEETTFCLNDGAPLISVGATSYEAPPTMQMPPSYATDQPSQPYQSYQSSQPYQPSAQPLYAQPSGTGFKITNKVLGISGAVLLLLGTFMPIISLMGLLTFSLFTFIQGLPTGPTTMPDAAGAITMLRLTGLAILLLGICSLLLALKNQFKALIATGAISLIVLVLIFVKLQSIFSTVPGELRMVIGIGWGFFAMVAAAILLIVAGLKKENTQTTGAGWPSTPPPNYR